jgi:hypothetical protein
MSGGITLYDWTTEELAAELRRRGWATFEPPIYGTGWNAAEILRATGAIVIERDEDGKWPDDIFRAVAKELADLLPGVMRHQTPITETTVGHWAGRIVGAFLDALATNQPGVRDQGEL